MWESKHIFIHDYALIDKFLKGHLLPYLDSSLESYFFIRYWDGGPHIRLRYKTPPGQDNIFEQSLKQLLEEFKNLNIGYNFSPVKYNPKFIKLEKVQPTDPYPNFSVQEIAYVPEIYRYGGQASMPICEKLFIISSKFASTVIQNFNYNKRHIIAIDLMYKCAEMAQELGYLEEIHNFFLTYRKIWEQLNPSQKLATVENMIRERIKKIQEKKITMNFYQEYLTHFRKIAKHIKTCQTTMPPTYAYNILISHVHMLNNRLGISPEYEYTSSKVILETC